MSPNSTEKLDMYSFKLSLLFHGDKDVVKPLFWNITVSLVSRTQGNSDSLHDF